MKTDIYEMVEGRHGRFLANPEDTYIGRSMLTYGEFSELEWSMLNQLIQPGQIVIEAGANMGSFTVPIAKKVGLKGMVYAFEPQLAIFQQMCANLALNDLLNVQAFNAGCGAAEDWMPIVRPNPSRTNNFGGFSMERLKGNQTLTRVRIEALDNVLDIPALALIKADVEGMECAVIDGASGLIAKYRPLLYMEANEPDAPALIEKVMGLDYRMYWHLPRMFNPDNYLANSENIFGNIVSKNVFCVPAENNAVVNGAREISGPEDTPANWAKTRG